MSGDNGAVRTLEDIDRVLGDDGHVESPSAGVLVLADASEGVEGRVSRVRSGKLSSPQPNPGGLSVELHWVEVKKTFIQAKSLDEIDLIASGLPLCDWLDYAIKMMPKALNVKGQFQMQSIVAQLGPVNRKARSSE